MMWPKPLKVPLTIGKAAQGIEAEHPARATVLDTSTPLDAKAVQRWE